MSATAALPVESISDALRAETKAFCGELEQLIATIPAVNTVPAEESRRARREGRGIFPAPVHLDSARTTGIPAPAGELPVRVIAPATGEARGAFLHFHGGGWTLGDHDGQDLRLQRLADATDLVVASVGYRLAPEHPYPAGPDDCEAAALWLLEHPHELGVPRDAPRALGGDSAGAHLAATTLLRLRDRHGIAGAFAAVVFQYGAFDLSLTPSQRLWGERNLVLSTPIIRWFGDNFLAGLEPERRRDPDISPLYAPLHDMPPAIFTCGTEDPLLDDTLFMAQRWRVAGHGAEVKLWPEAPHGFVSLPMRIGGIALEAEHDFVRRTLAGLA